MKSPPFYANLIMNNICKAYSVGAVEYTDCISAKE